MNNIEFSRMIESDIKLAVKWIREPEVIDVWDSAQVQTDEEVYQKYCERLNSIEIDTYTITINTTKVGVIQSYMVSNLSDFGIENPNTMGIDLYIGEPNFRNKGIGTKVIAQFIEEFIFSNPKIQFVCIDPEIANERAIRTYEKVGFIRHNVSYDSHSDLLTLYMKMSRQEFKKKA